MTATEVCQLFCGLCAIGHLAVFLLLFFALGVTGILGTRKREPRRSRDVFKEVGILFLVLVYELGPYGLLCGVSSLVWENSAATMAVLVGTVFLTLEGIGLLALAAWSYCRHDRRYFCEWIGAALGFGPMGGWMCVGFVTAVALVLRLIL